MTSDPHPASDRDRAPTVAELSSTVLRPASSVQLLATIPALLEQTVDAGLVLVLFRRVAETGRLRSAGSMRIDGTPGDLAVADSGRSPVAALLHRVPWARGVAVVDYTRERFAAHHGIPRRPELAALATEIERSGRELIDACCVAPDGWGSLLDPDVPPDGHPLSLIAEDPMALESRLHLAREAVSTDELARLPTADPSTAREVATWTRTLLADLPSRFPLSQLDRVLGAAPERIASDLVVTRPESLAASSLARMAALLQIGLARELALASIAYPDGISGLLRRAAADVGATFASRAPTPAHERMVHLSGPIMKGQLVKRPDLERLQGAAHGLRHLCALLPPDLSTGPRASLAWTFWIAGKCATAYSHLAAARDLDSGHRLIRLFGPLCKAGAMPEWVREAASG